MTTQLARCRYCGAEIFFARTQKRALMPLEADPVPADAVPFGSRWAYDEAELTCRPCPNAKSPERVYVPHFGTCPETQKTAPGNATLRAIWDRNRA